MARTKIMFNYEHILCLRKLYAAFFVNKALLAPVLLPHFTTIDCINTSTVKGWPVEPNVTDIIIFHQIVANYNKLNAVVLNFHIAIPLNFIFITKSA